MPTPQPRAYHNGDGRMRNAELGESWKWEVGSEGEVELAYQSKQEVRSKLQFALQSAAEDSSGPFWSENASC